MEAALPPFTLVLGGGGLSGVAWTTGLLAGLEDEGIALRGAQRVIGTSAGAAVAAQLASALTLEQLFARQADPAQHTPEFSPALPQLMAFLTALRDSAAIADPLERRKHLCAVALRSDTIDEAERRRVVAGRLPAHDWPSGSMMLTAIDAETGELRVFDAAANVDLVDAVAASCAVPAVWPAVTIGNRRYVDGGLRSPDNADLAAGDPLVVVVSPIGGMAAEGTTSSLASALVALEASGSRAIALEPDRAARQAMGVNALDPAVRAPSAEAGRIQGRREARRLRNWLGS
jgi:NTE family protein